MRLKRWRQIVSEAFVEARDAYGESGLWWPEQAPGTTLSWAIAMRWMFYGTTPYQRNRDVWVCSAWGKDAANKRALLTSPTCAVETDPTVTTATRRFDPHEYMVDFSIWPQRNNANDPLLSMESECFASSGVEATVEPSNGYAYDFLKVLLLPSPRRIFVCRVNEPKEAPREEGSRGRPPLNRKQRVLRSLESIARRSSRHLRERDELSVAILASAKKQRKRSILAVWDAKEDCFTSTECDPTIPP